jgi:formylglycine-generating enzyme required for sulfatase activity
MMAPNNSPEKQLPVAAEILPVAQLVSLSDGISPTPDAAKPTPTPRRKSAHKGPPWHKILIANAVLFAIICAVYLMLPGKDAKQLAKENAADKSSRQSGESAKAETASNNSQLPDRMKATPVVERRSADRNADVTPVLSLTSNTSAPRNDNKSVQQEIAIGLAGGVTLELVLIPAGEFRMGSPEGQGEENERPQHQVRITKPFYLGKYPVTQEQWQAVMNSNPSDFKGPKNPVENVSWDDCQVFLSKLSEKSAAGGGKFQLPSEAQWEYACRAGSTTPYCFGDEESGLGEYAWYGENSGSKTHRVGEKKPNAFGLYDLHGNVWEWCQDCCDYAQSVTDDPTGPPGHSLRVYRGGHWGDPAKICRSAKRILSEPAIRGNYLGLRVCLVLADNSESAHQRDEPPQKLVVATPSVPTEPSKPPKKHAIPSAPVREAMLTQMKEIYRDRKVNTLDEANKLINELRDLAFKTKNPDEKFVLLCRVAQCACVIKDADMMLHTIDEIGNDFEIDPFSVKEKMLVEFAEGADRPQAVERLFNSAQGVIDAALAAERYDIALSIATAVNKACQRREGKDWRSQAQSRRGSIDALRTHWRAFKDGEASLKSDANDGDANLAVGRWWCFDKNDWNRALPYFAKGSDEAMKLVSAHDLAQKPDQLDDNLRLADDWRDLGFHYSDYQREPILRRAIGYYERALGMMEPGLKKATVEKRLADVKAAVQNNAVGRKVAIVGKKPTADSEPTPQTATVPKDKKNPSGSGTGGKRVVTKAGVNNGAKRVSLTGPPYPESYPGSPTDKLSVQYAVIEVLKQVGLKYDFNGSRQRTDPVCRQWCRPSIANQPWPAALEAILGPVGLTYEVNGDTVVLKRK